MTRLERKNREDIEFKGVGGITDIIDDATKDTWRINDEEYDYICAEANDEELDCFVGILASSDISFSDKRKAIQIVNNLLERKNA